MWSKATVLDTHEWIAPTRTARDHILRRVHMTVLTYERETLRVNPVSLPQATNVGPFDWPMAYQDERKKIGRQNFRVHHSRQHARTTNPCPCRNQRDKKTRSKLPKIYSQGQPNPFSYSPSSTCSKSLPIRSRNKRPLIKAVARCYNENTQRDQQNWNDLFKHGTVSTFI